MPTSRVLNEIEKARFKELMQHPILRNYAKRILYLEFKHGKTKKEKRELLYLSDPGTARYAKIIVNLQFAAKRTPIDGRFLQLLLLPNMRDNAHEIAYELEPNIVDKSSGDIGIIHPSAEKKLSLFYFYQMYNVPLKWQNFQVLAHSTQCGTSSDRKNINASTKRLEHSFFNKTTATRYQSAFEMLQKRILEGSSQIVSYYLKEMNAEPSVLSAPSAQQYIHTKTALLALSIKKHLAIHKSPEIKDDYITQIFKTLKKAIKFRVFTLQGDKLFSINLIDRIVNSPTRKQAINDPIEEAKWRLFRESAAKLSRYRVTPEFISEHWRGEWLKIHSELLEFLVDGLPITDRLSPKDALQEMSSLSEHQADALKILYQHGLRGSDLRTYPGIFELNSKNALIHLVELQGMAIDDALDKLKTLSFTDMDELGAAWVLKSPPRM